MNVGKAQLGARVGSHGGLMSTFGIHFRSAWTSLSLGSLYGGQSLQLVLEVRWRSGSIDDLVNGLMSFVCFAGLITLYEGTQANWTREGSVANRLWCCQLSLSDTCIQQNSGQTHLGRIGLAKSG